MNSLAATYVWVISHKPFVVPTVYVLNKPKKTKGKM